MINVLHLRDTDRVCGPGKTIIETACATDRTAFSQKIGLFLPQGDARNAYYDAAERRGVEVIPLRAAHPYDPRLIGTIIDVIKRHEIHLVHAHEYKSDLLTFALSRLHAVPVMTTVHGWITHTWKRQMVVGVSQRVLRYFDRVVAVSEGTRQRVLACGVPARKVEVIHNAIVVEHYRPEDQSAGWARARFGLSADAFLIGSVGRLSPEKGQFDLLAGLAPLVTQHPRVHLVLAGDGPDRPGLERRAAELGIGDHVHFTGHLSDVRPVYRDLDLLALTSHTEGFPNVVLEALCMDTPVLATDVGGTGEIVRDGVTGLLIPARDPERITSGLRRLLEHPDEARALAVEGKRVVADQFSFRQRVAREEALYRQILDEWHARRRASAGARVA